MNPVVNVVKLNLQALWLPVLLLVIAWFLAPYGKQIPESFSGVWEIGPYLMMVVLAGFGMAYNRGRALLVALLLLLAIYLVDQPEFLQGWGRPDLFYFVLAGLVPVNLAIVGGYKERGIFTFFGFFRILVIVAQLLLFVGFYYFWPETFSRVLNGLSFELLKTEDVQSPQYPHITYILIVLSGTALLVAANWQRLNLSFAIFVALCGFVTGILFLNQPDLFHTNAIAIGILLCIAILKDSYNMAYRDELTGLPQRRALNELFMSLGGDYAVAMMDVDHFKKFNDTHGHDIGDEVLKMVAAQIGKVRDGGKAFRYGGEEFTVVYPGKMKEQALMSLEEVRETIESYELVIRAPRKKKNNDSAKAKRGKGPGPDAKRVSVTISIGVADRTDRYETPEDILKKADKALYQAKEAGRNQTVLWGLTPTRGQKTQKKG